MFFFYGMRRYGKAHATSRFGTCDACGKAATLTSYVTAQFLHLYWIPLIPIGHVRIIDACPHCDQCRIISPRKYRKLKEKNEASLLEKLRTSPDDPELVCGVLGHWSSFNDADNFEKTAAIYQARMQHNPKVTKAIAMGYFRLGLFAKAEFAARRLPESEPGRSELLQAAQAHFDVEAAECGTSNRVAGLPIFLPYLVPALIIFMILGNLFAEGFRSGRAREVWLISGSLHPYTVLVDDSEYQLNAMEKRTIKIPMGMHRVQITNTLLPIEPFSFEYSLPFSKRIGDDRVLVLNPDGLAFLIEGHIPYTITDSYPVAEPRYEYRFGKQWHVLPEIDFAFCDLPDNVTMPSGKNLTYKTQLTQFEPSTYLDVINALYANDGTDAVPTWLKSALRLHPRNTEAHMMLQLAAGDNDRELIMLLERARAFRPVLLDWHRFYQDRMEQMDPSFDLIGEYQGLLEEEPDDAALKYLRGRVEPDDEKANALFLSAEQGAGCGGYGYNAIAYNRLFRLGFDEALQYACKAMACDSAQDRFFSTFNTACMATRQYQLLIDAIREEKAAAPENGELVALEVRYLHLLGHHDEASQAGRTYLQSTSRQMDAETSKQWAAYFDAAHAYASGDIATYLAKLEPVLPEEADFQQALHSGDVQLALDILDNQSASGFDSYLIVYGTAMHHRRLQVAKQALQKAIDALQSRPYVRAFLTDDNQVTPASLETADLLPDEKVLVSGALGFLHPERQEEYFALAKKCNYTPFFPQHLINSWMQKKTLAGTE